MERPISVLNIDYVFIYHCFLFFARHLTKTKKAVLRVWSDKKSRENCIIRFMVVKRSTSHVVPISVSPKFG